jgi:phosphoglycolate phosphatase
VLVDSFDAFLAAFAAACRRHGRPEVGTRERFLGLFEGNFYDGMAARGVAGDTLRAIVADTTAALDASPERQHPFPGVPELLRDLAARFDVVVITSNAAAVVRDFLTRAGLAGFVSDVLGVETDPSKVRKIATVTARYPGQAPYFYVGDTSGDMLEGAAAGATPLGAGWGWHGAAALAAAGAAYVASTPADLLAYVMDGAGS